MHSKRDGNCYELSKSSANVYVFGKEFVCKLIEVSALRC